MDAIVYISENRVSELLNWEQTYESIKCAMESVSKERAFQSKRSQIKLGNTDNFLFSMCGGLSDKKYGGLGCKLFTYFPENYKKNEPALKANIFLLDEETGSLKAVSYHFALSVNLYNKTEILDRSCCSYYRLEDGCSICSRYKISS